MPMTSSTPEIDFVRGTFYANDVHSTYQWLRENAPVYYDETNDLYGVALHEDVMMISKNFDIYGSHMGFRPDSLPMPIVRVKMKHRDPLWSRVYRDFEAVWN